MVALSFKPRFIEPYKEGRKGGTIRNPRRGREIIYPGVKLQLFTGMRTKQCRRFGEETCLQFRPIQLRLTKRPRIAVGWLALTRAFDLDRFAVFDGFDDFEDMAVFWQQTHAAETFSGNWTQWKEFEL